MSELQTQVHELRLHALKVGAENLAKALACPDCEGYGYLQYMYEPENGASYPVKEPCSYCNKNGALDIRDWPLGAISGVIEEAMPEGWAILPLRLGSRTVALYHQGVMHSANSITSTVSRDLATIAAATRCLQEMEKSKCHT